jgi:hypothetical protein
MDLSGMDPQTAALLQAMRAMTQGPSPQDAMQMEVSAADQLGPEGLKQQMALGSILDRMGLGRDVFGAQNDAYANQLAQGQKLQAQRFGNSGSAAGNLLGGLGDVFNTIRGGMMENKARAGMEDALGKYQQGQGGMLDRQDTGRGAYMNAKLEAMRRLLAAQQQQQEQQEAQREQMARPSAAGPLLPGGTYYSQQ